MFKFRAFKAIRDYESCLKYREGHRKVLVDYGITNITTNVDEWMTDPTVFCIVAEDEETNEIVGGVRIQLSTSTNKLPVEKAVGDMDSLVFEMIKKFRENGGVGEICALWNSKKVAGIGISILLIRAGISIVNQIEAGSLVTICADYTLPMVRKVGFIVEDSLGKEGEFVYPNENYIARVLRRINSITLDTATKYDRERIFNLRDNPVQTHIETGPKGEFKVEYNLILPSI